MQAPYNIPQAPQAAAPKRYDGKNGQPLYDAGHGGHYGASAQIAAQGNAPPPETFTGHWANVRAHDSKALGLMLMDLIGVTGSVRTV